MNAWDADAAPVGPRAFHGVEAYANACIEELGELPMFAGGADFDCAKAPGMTIVPITATDSSGRVTTLGKDTPSAGAGLAATRQCDRPAWLGYEDEVPGATQCAPFTRVGRYVNARGTRFVVICRRETVRDRDAPVFENINFIAHDPTSGKTCFLNNHLDGSSTDGAHVPPPNTPTSDRFWMDPGSLSGQRCPSCHDSDPWIHSPWIDQALTATGQTVVPRMGQDAAYSLATKYSILAPDSFAHVDAESLRNWAQPTHLPNVGACASCHRIGASMTTLLFAGRSVGEPEDWQKWLTAPFRSFAALHWMPPEGASPSSWASSPNGRSVSTILRCADDPSGCAVAETPH
jgi:hypothetical protein